MDSVDSIGFHCGAWLDLLFEIGVGGRGGLILLLLNLFNGRLSDDINPRFFFFFLISENCKSLVVPCLSVSAMKLLVSFSNEFVEFS